MKIGQLIERLQQLDPEAEAMVWHPEVQDWMEVETVEEFDHPPYPHQKAVRLST